VDSAISLALVLQIVPQSCYSFSNQSNTSEPQRRTKDKGREKKKEDPAKRGKYNLIRERKREKALLHGTAPHLRYLISLDTKDITTEEQQQEKNCPATRFVALSFWGHTHSPTHLLTKYLLSTLLFSYSSIFCHLQPVSFSLFFFFFFSSFPLSISASVVLFVYCCWFLSIPSKLPPIQLLPSP